MPHPNKYKFLAPPTIEQIEAVIKKSGANESHFEAYHGMYRGCISNHRIGFRKVPLKFWHLFLEDTRTAPNKLTNISPIKTPAPRPKVSADSRLSGLV